MIIVEGEADLCALLSAGHSSACGTPGCTPGRAAIQTMAEVLKDRHVIVGTVLIEVGCKVKTIPPGGGDLDERLNLGETLEAVLATAVPWQLPKQTAAEMAHDLEGKALAELAPVVNNLLNDSAGRENKQQASQLVCLWFKKTDMLLCDHSIANIPAPYVLLESGIAAPVDIGDDSLRVALHSAGLNTTESAFRWTVAELEAGAKTEGRRGKGRQG